MLNAGRREPTPVPLVEQSRTHTFPELRWNLRDFSLDSHSGTTLSNYISRRVLQDWPVSVLHVDRRIKPCFNVKLNWRRRISRCRTVLSLVASSSVSRISCSTWSSLADWVFPLVSSSTVNETQYRNKEELAAELQASDKTESFFDWDLEICCIAIDLKNCSSSRSSSDSNLFRCNLDSSVIPIWLTRCSLNERM